MKLDLPAPAFVPATWTRHEMISAAAQLGPLTERRWPTLVRDCAPIGAGIEPIAEQLVDSASLRAGTRHSVRRTAVQAAAVAEEPSVGSVGLPAKASPLATMPATVGKEDAAAKAVAAATAVAARAARARRLSA